MCVRICVPLCVHEVMLAMMKSRYPQEKLFWEIRDNVLNTMYRHLYYKYMKARFMPNEAESGGDVWRTCDCLSSKSLAVRNFLKLTKS